MIQFSFSSRGIVPDSIRRLERETQAQSLVRKARASGVLEIEPTERISIEAFPQDLLLAGYEMVDAFYQPRDDHGKTYHIARFIFVRHDYALDIAEEFLAIRDSMCAELQKICDSAFWRVRAFKNPFFKNDVPIDGQYAVSVNLEVRVPLKEPSGKLVTQWRKDVNGSRIGDAPAPIEPNGQLRLQGGQIRLFVADDPGM